MENKNKTKKHITLIEIIIVIGLFINLILRWNVNKITLGDLFSLELLAIMFYYRYDDFKNKHL
jgi:hypothetical protein